MNRALGLHQLFGPYPALEERSARKITRAPAGTGHSARAGSAVPVHGRCSGPSEQAAGLLFRRSILDAEAAAEAAAGGEGWMLGAGGAGDAVGGLGGGGMVF